jgi:hypothetical protein
MSRPESKSSRAALYKGTDQSIWRIRDRSCQTRHDRIHLLATITTIDPGTDQWPETAGVQASDGVGPTSQMTSSTRFTAGAAPPRPTTMPASPRSVSRGAPSRPVTRSCRLSRCSSPCREMPGATRSSGPTASTTAGHCVSRYRVTPEEGLSGVTTVAGWPP